MKQFGNMLKIGTYLQGQSYQYIIEEVLGQGSFGITYLASVKMTGALGTIDANVRVAIKEFFMEEINGRQGTTVTSGSKDGLFYDYKKKFIRETQNLSKLKHPNIIKVVEEFEANNTAYYVMEYIDGGSLDDYIMEKHGLPIEEAIRLTCQIGEALSYMHSQKMLHLDLKPGNIMLKKNGDVVLIDFGLSKQYDEKGQPESSTTVGAGTRGYAPLEQANYRDGRDFPITMDVYALGATLLKMLTGMTPPDASDILNDGFPKDEIRVKGVSDELVALVAKAMSPMVKQRYQTVIEFVQACSNWERNIPMDIPMQEDTDLLDSVLTQAMGTDSKTEYDNAILYRSKGANGKWGFADKKGNYVIACQWDDVGYFHENLATVKDSAGKWGYIDKLGNLVIPCLWDDSYSFNKKGMAVVKSCNQAGIIDKTGKLIAFGFHSILDDDFPEGFARIINESDLWGLIDKSGNIVVQCQWKRIEKYRDGIAKAIDKYDKVSFIDNKGEIVSSNKWLSTGTFSEGLAGVKDSTGKWGYIDKNGKVVISCQWQGCREFSEGLAGVKDSTGKWGYIDKNGKVVIPCQWKGCQEFSEGLAAVKQTDYEWGFIDKKGNLIIAYQYFEILSVFHDGLAALTLSPSLSGLIDKTGKTVCIQDRWSVVYYWFPEESPKYWHTCDFYNNWGLISHKGEMISNCQWGTAVMTRNSLSDIFLVKDKNGKYGFIDKVGNVVLPCLWDFLLSFDDNGLAYAKKETQAGYINKTGQFVWFWENKNEK